MRGLALFDLTRLFGMPYTLDNGASLGVPIEIKTELPTHQPSRNTVAECYNQVIKDLTGYEYSEVWGAGAMARRPRSP